VFPSALGTFVPHAAAAFATDHPAVELRFTEAEPPTPPACCTSARSTSPCSSPTPTPPRLTNPACGSPRCSANRSTSSPPADRPGDTLADHAAGRWITGCERCRAYLLRACADGGFTPDIAFTTDDYVAVQALVAAGLGATTLPALALAAHHHPAVRTVRLAGQERLISAALYGQAPDPPATTALLTHLAAAAQAIQL
jgi:DNA-binding transcriptional LysR family regulator